MKPVTTYTIDEALAAARAGEVPFTEADVRQALRFALERQAALATLGESRGGRHLLRVEEGGPIHA